MRRRFFIFVIAISGLSAGCVDGFFACDKDEQCHNVAGGRCESTGFCSAPDVICASGYRYEKYSGRLSGACVSPQIDLGVVDAAAAVSPNDLCSGSAKDPNNCGACGVVCADGQVCNNGVCGCPAAIPNFCSADMGAFCTNEQTDNENCGACGNACPPGQLCQAGACVETCSTTPIVYTACTTYCADENNDPNNCGGCNAICPVDIHAVAVECSHGACNQSCNLGYDSCGTSCCAQSVLELLAGQLGGTGNIDGTGAMARFTMPTGIAVDQSGNIYVSDDDVIRKISASGAVRTIAGTSGVTGSADGSGSAAQFNHPWGVAADSSGNVYVSDANNDTIRKITPSGLVSTVAGSAGVGGSADGSGSAAQFLSPAGVTVDSSGNLFVADTGNFTIREITPNGLVTTLAGLAGNGGTTDGTGSVARFSAPQDLCVDINDNLYVADSGGAIRKIIAGGVVSTLAGQDGGTGTADGTGSAARFFDPNGVTVDGSGNVFVADTLNGTVREISPSGVVSTFAGMAHVGGTADGTGSAARFTGLDGISVDGSGNLFVTDSLTIRKITPNRVVSTLAGATTGIGSADGTGSAAQFVGPSGVTVDSSGNVYVADTYNRLIRTITAGGVVSTLAGNTGAGGTADGTGSAAQFYFPESVAVDGSGNVYVADKFNDAIRKVTASGVVSTFAGNAGTNGTVNGTGSAARFNSPQGIAIDATGTLYVADTYNNLIREITPSGVVSTLAGNAGTGTTDGTGSAAQFNSPQGVAVDSNGNVYVADPYNNLIRKITSLGVVSTLAGSGGVAGFVDGTGNAALFDNPEGVGVDSSGNVFVADTNNNVIRKITASGVVTTVVGAAGGKIGDQLGPLPAALVGPTGVVVSGDTLIIATPNENAILRATKVGGF